MPRAGGAIGSRMKYPSSVSLNISFQPLLNSVREPSWTIIFSMLSKAHIRSRE